MSIQHKELSAGRWEKMLFCEQMANIGSEVGRALNWREKGQEELSKNALYRAFELLDLSIGTSRQYSRLKELLSIRECLADFFCGANKFSSTGVLWRKYFNHFNYAARKQT